MLQVLFLALAVVALWINLWGAGFAAQRFVGDFPVARVVGVAAVCLVCFFLEHFAGWGPHPPLLPFTTALSLLFIWRGRPILREHWRTEALFTAGFAYCFVWQYTFPDIDFTGEKMPNLMMIEGYMRGGRLPAPDLWLPPYSANFYYGFQHYGASLMGRILDLGPGVSYHLAYCVLVGFIVMLMGSCVGRLCPWTPGRWVAVLALIFGGSGAVVATHVLINGPGVIDSVRFLGGSIIHDHANAWGRTVARWMDRSPIPPHDLPMEPMSYILTTGDYHPPLSGYLLLAVTAVLIVAQEAGVEGRRRALNHALLAATIPLALISNAWIAPLQGVLVAGWFVYRLIRGERGFIAAAIAGAAVAIAFEYPYLIEFLPQSIGTNANISVTRSEDRTPWLGWLITFGPVLGILVLGLFSRERRPFVRFLIAIWAAELAATELLYNHDVYGGAWSRFNSTLKWWGWVYAGIVLTVGVMNLGSASKIRRYGTVLLLLPTLVFGYDLGASFVRQPKGTRGRLSGSGWIDKDVVIRDLVLELASRPDGIALESGLVLANTASPAEVLFAGKLSFLGWPWHETTWRGPYIPIHERQMQIDAFYAGKMPNRLDWLLDNNIRYVLWMPRDIGESNRQYWPLNDEIKARYFWHHVYGDGSAFEIGWWERIDEPMPNPPGN